MEYRQLGASGLFVPVLSFGTGTFGGTNGFEGWGDTQVTEAARMINTCLDTGLNLFDTANIYSMGDSEIILGKAIKGLRDKLLISTKATFKMGDDRNMTGSSRHSITKACEDSLRRLETDHIDIYHMHGFDANTPVEETLKTLDGLVTSGKVRYIACSNFSGWHLMKSLSISERYGWSRYVGHQVYYSLLNRDYEWELMPLGIDQNVGSLIWSPLAAGRLAGRYRRGQHLPEGRVSKGASPVGDEVMSYEHLYNIIDVLDEIATETGKTIAQISLNWLLQRPTVCSLVIGARTEKQLDENLGAIGWTLTSGQVKRLDDVSSQQRIYPYWHQALFPELKSQLFL